MLLSHVEKASTPYLGTIIDIETIGGFRDYYSDLDSRRQSGLTPTMLGYLCDGSLKINYIETTNDLPAFISQIEKVLPLLPRPFYAFNCDFEASVFFHTCDMKIVFDYELNLEKYEAKWRAVKSLGINNYDDPYFDDGKLCRIGWEKGEYQACVSHNRSCLLKERDILLKRGTRKPNKISFIST